MSGKKRAPMLLEENPILVYPSLAVELGINKAVVFQQLHFLLNGQKESKNEYNYVDDRWWVYNSYPEWQRDYFPWLSLSSLKGIFNSLEDDGLVLARQSVKNKSDRRKWYTIDYETWDKKCLTIGQNLSDGSSDKKYPLVGQEIANGYSKTSSKTSKEKKPRSHSRKESDAITPLRQRLEPNIVLAAALLELFDAGYQTAIHKPAEYLITKVQLEKYVPILEDLARLNATPEEIRAVYQHLKPGYTKNGWTIGLKTIVEKLPAYRVWRANGGEKKIITGVWAETEAPELPNSNLSPEERARLVAETRAQRGQPA